MTAPTTTTSPLGQPRRGSWVRAHTGAWAAAATLATYWGLTGAGFLLRLVNDPALKAADQLLTRVIWGAWPTIGAVIVARQPRNRHCRRGRWTGPELRRWSRASAEPGAQSASSSSGSPTPPC